MLLLHDLGSHRLSQYHRDLFLHWEFLLVLSAYLRQGLAMQPRLASTHWLACCLWFPSAGTTTAHYHTWLSPKVLYFTFRFLIHFKTTFKTKDLFLIMRMCGYLCVSMYTWVQRPQRPEEGIRCPGVTLQAVVLTSASSVSTSEYQDCRC